jgi:hypothetical protein
VRVSSDSETSSSRKVDPSAVNAEAAGDKGDLFKLQRMLVTFLRMMPFYLDDKAWSTHIDRPYWRDGSSANRIKNILQGVTVRHRIEELEKEIELPPLHRRIVSLDLSYFGRLTYNIIVSLFVGNSVTSQRVDVCLLVSIFL